MFFLQGVDVNVLSKYGQDLYRYVDSGLLAPSAPLI